MDPKENAHRRVENLGKQYEDATPSMQRHVAKEIGIKPDGIQKGAVAAQAQAHVGDIPAGAALANFQSKGMGPKP